MGDLRTHPNMVQTAPGLWEVAIPIHPTGLLGWKVRRACRDVGGHFFHANRQWGWSCCRCGYVDENPNMPKGHPCGPPPVDQHLTEGRPTSE